MPMPESSYVTNKGDHCCRTFRTLTLKTNVNTSLYRISSESRNRSITDMNVFFKSEQVIKYKTQPEFTFLVLVCEFWFGKSPNKLISLSFQPALGASYSFSSAYRWLAWLNCCSKSFHSLHDVLLRRSPGKNFTFQKIRKQESHLDDDREEYAYDKIVEGNSVDDNYKIECLIVIFARIFD